MKKTSKRQAGELITAFHSAFMSTITGGNAYMLNTFDGGHVQDFIDAKPEARLQMLSEWFNNSCKLNLYFVDPVKNTWAHFLSGGKSTETLEKEMSTMGIQIEHYAGSMMHSDSFVTTKYAKMIRYAKKSVKELGFTGNSYSAFREWISNHSVYELCQPEDGPHIRLQYMNQPIGECVNLIMDCIKNDDGDGGNSHIFCLKNKQGSLTLDTQFFFFYPGFDFGPESLFFLRFREGESL